MIFAITSVLVFLVGATLVGFATQAAGYHAGEVLVFGGMWVSGLATLLAVVSFVRKENRVGSTVSLIIALSPFLIWTWLVLKSFAHDLASEFRKKSAAAAAVVAPQAISTADLPPELIAAPASEAQR